MRLLLAVLCLAPAALAQPVAIDSLHVDEGVTLHFRLTPITDGTPGLAFDSRGTVSAVGDCADYDRLTPLAYQGEFRGYRLDRAVVVIERPTGRRDSVRLEVECLFVTPQTSDYGSDYGFNVNPAPMPFAGGWRISHGYGDGDGYAGDWIVGRSGDAHRTGAPAPFQDTEDTPSIERLRTEAVLLRIGTDAERARLDACREQGDGVCSDPGEIRQHERWLTALQRWAEVAAFVGMGAE